MSEKIIKFRPLNKVMSLVDETKHKVTYVYDDLVFIEHSEIILKFNDHPENSISLFIHEDINHKDQSKIKKKFIVQSKNFDLTMKFEGTFSLSERVDEEKIDIKFKSIPKE